MAVDGLQQRSGWLCSFVSLGSSPQHAAHAPLAKLKCGGILNLNEQERMDVFQGLNRNIPFFFENIPASTSGTEFPQSSLRADLGDIHRIQQKTTGKTGHRDEEIIGISARGECGGHSMPFGIRTGRHGHIARH